MGRLTADFAKAFSRDLKKNAKRRNWNLTELEKVIDLVVENTLSGNWRGRYECHVANAGDWLVIWSSNDSVAFFERTGSHDELFR